MNEKINIGYVTLGIKIKRSIWNLVQLLLFRPFGTKLFRLWRIALLKLLGADIDWNAEVYASAKVWAPWQLKLEAGACIGPNTIIYNQAQVTLKKGATLSQYAYICTAGHETAEVNNAQSGLVVAPVTLHEQAWVGTRAFIGMGVEVGQKSIVGACACVFKDVESGTIVGGNPAKVIKG